MKVDDLAATLRRLRLFGLLARIDEVRDKPWLDEVLAIEVEEKTRRSLAHRVHLAGIGPFKPVTDFDWKWPRQIDRPLLEDIFTLGFVTEGVNVVLLGPNGVGKTAHFAHHEHPFRAIVSGRSGPYDRSEATSLWFSLGLSFSSPWTAREATHNPS
jgi:hypothetical protein